MKRTKEERKQHRRNRRKRRRARFEFFKLRIKNLFKSITENFRQQHTFDVEKWDENFEAYWPGLKFFLLLLADMPAFKSAKPQLVKLVQLGDLRATGFETEFTARVKGIIQDINDKVEIIALFAPKWVRDEFEYFMDLLDWIAGEDHEPEIVDILPNG